MMGVDMIVSTDKEGKMKPIRFRVQDGEGEYQTINIIGYKIDNYPPGYIRYTSRVEINNTIHLAEIYYEIKSTTWKLEKLDNKTF